jgi:hypothetical protein
MARMVALSRNSIIDGRMPEAMMRATAVMASAALPKIAAMVSAGSGTGRSASVAWVITPSVPSEPTISRVRS